jgi:bifunctional ADP-heptose synthase (sugar kinase/adenylyltransferase)
VVDPKGGDFGRYKGATVLTPNRREAIAATGLETNDDDSLAAMGTALIERFDVEAAVITRSENGMSLVTRNGGAQHLPALAREVFDVSGAGDTVAAMLAMALGCGAALPDAVRLANHAAGVVVGKVGTSVGDPRRPVVRRRSQGHVLAGRRRTDRTVASEQRPGRLHQWLFRSPSPRTYFPDRTGAGRLRPTHCRAQQRRFRGPAQG